MYDSGITIAALESQINGEADISTSISSSVYIRWVNIVQQLLYADLIEDFRYAIVTTSGDITLADIVVGDDEAAVSYDDIIKIYTSGGAELEKVSAITAASIPDKDYYYFDGEKAKLHCIDAYESVTVIYKARPALATSTDDEIYIPYEWTEMLAAKVRGEIYKLANEDNLAAKWLNDYNTQLESFKVWIAKRNARYGE